jgi:periplasmic mercuric ion binding protein
MKQLSLVLIAFLGLSLASIAQQKVNGKAVINTPGATCDVCKDRIENYLSRQYGITSVKVDTKKKTTTVTWITDRTNIEEVKTNIANAGFDADDVTAEETSFNRLPRECKVVATAPVADSTKKP